MKTLEERIAALEQWRERVESHINLSLPLGPNPEYRRRLEQERQEEFERIAQEIAEKVKAT